MQTRSWQDICTSHLQYSLLEFFARTITLEHQHRYFHKAPNREELFHETVRKLKDLTYFDCLRANKSTMAWGVEARVPFLDKDWLDLAMTLDPVHKMCGTHPDGKKIEKWALRT